MRKDLSRPFGPSFSKGLIPHAQRIPPPQHTPIPLPVVPVPHPLFGIIMAVVRNGVRQANAGLIESVQEIEKSVHDLKMGINKKESG